MAAAAILDAYQCAFSDMIIEFYIEFATSPTSLVRIGRILKKWMEFVKKFKMADTAILKNGLEVDSAA